MRVCRSFVLPILLCLISILALGQSTKPVPNLDRLRARLQELVNAFPGTMGVAVRDIATSQQVSINGDRQFPMASAYKIPILVEVFRQAEAKKFSLDDRIDLTADDRTLGSGVLTLMAPGLKPTIRDLALLMIILSDNQATDMLLTKVGAENVTATMRKLGLNNIRVDRTTFELIRDYLALIDESAAGKTKQQLMNRPQLNTSSPERVAKADLEFSKIMKDVASPDDMARLLDLIVKGKAASEDSCRQMMTIMNRQQFNHRLPRYLPEGTGFAHKTGTIGSTTNDAGVMFIRGNPVALVVFTVDKRTGRGEIEEQMGRLARVVYDFFDAVK
ncbi:MAG: serine hydrolase [Acidobacteriota bacterium]|nr:serine hydrolase [Acidobacteriota bacterium]